MKVKEIREMTPEDREKKLKEIRVTLMHERGAAAMGGAPSNPGKIGTLRKGIARILTIIREERR
jgi:large subunit ribosomal protein L29